MGLFSRKPKVTVAEFCRDHYDRFVFPAPRQGFDMTAAYWAGAFSSVAQADPGFLSANKARFAHEMTVVRLELIGLAFLHSAHIDLAPVQSLFTWQYLRDTNRAAFWDEMEIYNDAISEACAHGCDRQTPAGRARVTFVNALRVNFFEKWCESGLEPKNAIAHGKCIARTKNRIGTSASWDDVVLPSYLGSTLIHRLGIDDVNPEARFQLQAQMFGIYEGAAKPSLP